MGRQAALLFKPVPIPAQQIIINIVRQGRTDRPSGRIANSHSISYHLPVVVGFVLLIFLFPFSLTIPLSTEHPESPVSYPFFLSVPFSCALSSFGTVRNRNCVFNSLITLFLASFFSPYTSLLWRFFHFLSRCPSCKRGRFLNKKRSRKMRERCKRKQTS